MFLWIPKHYWGHGSWQTVINLLVFLKYSAKTNTKPKALGAVCLQEFFFLLDTKEIGKDSHRSKKSSLAVFPLLSAMWFFSLRSSCFLHVFPCLLLLNAVLCLFGAFLFLQRESLPSPGQVTENNKILPPTQELYHCPTLWRQRLSGGIPVGLVQAMPWLLHQLFMWAFRGKGKT